MKKPEQNADLQQTLAASITRSGIGLHSGRLVEITLYPAPPDTGIVFQRIDRDGMDNIIPASVSHVSDVMLNTSIANREGVAIGTIEHLMAAFAGLGIDNARVDVSGPELPAFDGSAAPYCDMISEAGIKSQHRTRQYVKVVKSVTVSNGISEATIIPADFLKISVMIDFPDPFIGASQYFYVHDNNSFVDELASARTFCMHQDISRMRSNGCAMGGSLDNAIVIRDGQMMNEEPLRFTDEFVRHKTLDCLGDLRLAGHNVLGHLTAKCPGHKINSELLKALFDDPTAYRIVEAQPNGASSAVA